jgi:hypothetical protein
MLSIYNLRVLFSQNRYPLCGVRATLVLAAKQRELTYYRQRDGIVKSVPGLIRLAAGAHPDCMIGANTAKSGLAARFGRIRT